MTDEDRTAERLKGNNCLIKFKDGEELTLHMLDLDGTDDEEITEWFQDVEKFINGDDNSQCCPIPDIAISREAIKYIRKI